MQQKMLVEFRLVDAAMYLRRLQTVDTGGIILQNAFVSFFA